MATGTKIGELYYSITGDSSKLTAELTKSEKNITTFGGAVSKVGGFIAKSFAVLTGIFTGLGVATIGAASDAEETRNKFNVVFSSIQTDAENASKSLVENYGLSSKASQQLLSDTGDLLTGFGFTQQSALSLSTTVNKLAVDLASFTNYSGGAAGASQAITKALLGETESMKSLGVSIQQNTKEFQNQVKAQMEATGATERQAKATVILNQIMEQSKNSIGDFARSQDSFANQSRILQARFEDFTVLLGEEFLPIATSIVGRLSELIGNIMANDSAMTVLRGTAQALGVVFNLLFDAINLVGNILAPFVDGMAQAIEKQERLAITSKILGEEKKKENEEYKINQERVERLLNEYKRLEEEQSRGIDKTKEMESVIKSINAIYPNSIAYTDGQSLSYNQLTAQVKSYSQELIHSLEIEEARNQLIEKRKNLQDITPIFEKQSQQVDELNLKLTEYEGSLISASDMMLVYGENWRNDFAKLQAPEVLEKLSAESLDKLFRLPPGAVTDVENLVQELTGFDQVSKAFEVANAEFEDAQKNLDALGASLQEIGPTGIITTTVNTTGDTSKEKEKAKLLHDFKVELINNERENFIDALNEKLNAYKEAFGAEIEIDGKKYNLDVIRARKVADFDAEMADKQLETAKDLAEEKRKIEEDAERKRQEDRKAELDGIKDTITTIADYVMQVGDIIGQFLDQNLERQMIQLEAEKEAALLALDEKLQARLEAEGLAEETAVQRAQRELDEAIAAGDSEVVKEKEDALKKAKIYEEYNKEKERIETEAAAKQKELKKQQWELDRNIALFNAGVNTAVAITKALPDPIAVGFAALLGAAQIALIASQPTPNFGSGGIVPGNQFQGDNITANLDSGEMVLTRQQQKNLFEMIGEGGGSRPMIINIYTQDGRLLTRQVVDTINADGEYIIDLKRIGEV